MKIKITMEKTIRVAMEFEATKKQIKNLKCGENPFCEQMEKEMEYGAESIEYDYAVNDLDGNEIVPWG